MTAVAVLLAVIATAPAAVDLSIVDGDSRWSEGLSRELAAAGLRAASSDERPSALWRIVIDERAGVVQLFSRTTADARWALAEEIPVGDSESARRRAVVRTVESLRARGLVPPEPSAVAPAAAERERPWWLSLGPSVERSQGGLGWGVLGTLTVGRSARTGPTVWLQVGGTPFSTATPRTEAGVAETRRFRAGVGFGFRPPWWSRRWLLGVEAHGLVVTAEGQADAPYVGRAIEVFGVAMNGLVQVDLPLGQAWAFSLAVRAGGVVHEPVVRFVGEEVASLRGATVAAGVGVSHFF